MAARKRRAHRPFKPATFESLTIHSDGSKSFFLPARTVCESSNASHGNVWARSKRKKEQRAAVEYVTSYLKAPEQADFPIVISLTRLSAGVMDDDGLRSAMKYVRDALADWAGVDDGDVSMVRFAYYQAKCAPKEYGVRVRVYPRMRLVEELRAVV